MGMIKNKPNGTELQSLEKLPKTAENTLLKEDPYMLRAAFILTNGKIKTELKDGQRKSPHREFFSSEHEIMVREVARLNHLRARTTTISHFNTIHTSGGYQ